MELLTSKEVAELLKLNKQTVVRMIGSGRLPAVRIGKSYRIEKGELERWIKAQGEVKAETADKAPESEGTAI